MIYFRKNDEVIEKYQVDFDKEVDTSNFDLQKFNTTRRV